MIRRISLIAVVIASAACGGGGSSVGPLGSACGGSRTCEEGLSCSGGSCRGSISLTGDVIWLQENPPAGELHVGLMTTSSWERLDNTGTLERSMVVLDQVFPDPVYPTVFEIDGAAPGTYYVFAYVVLRDDPMSAGVGKVLVDIVGPGVLNDEFGNPLDVLRVGVLGVAHLAN